MRYFSILILLALLITAARAQLPTTGIGKVAGSGGGGGGCDGTIDLSTGCVQPMFGGL